VEFFFDQGLENFLLTHVHAFQDWGGAPRVILYDFVPGNKIILVLNRYAVGGTTLPGLRRRHPANLRANPATIPS
jgi:hypothetical protein